MPTDPLQQVLKDLRALRVRAHADLAKLPAPYPVKDALAEIDRVFKVAEEDLTSERYFITQWMKLPEASRRGFENLRFPDVMRR